ncbi:Sir2 family NAD-dependent protein deacetylase [Stutzerimonas nitrititolerans]|uniref:Sir2 family NAD-dependent protein deacetylase n=1 Tax=Stutzerimonas nitrititolerans TaxID=2482751 RepID=UPI0035E3C098
MGIFTLTRNLWGTAATGYWFCTCHDSIIDRSSQISRQQQLGAQMCKGLHGSIAQPKLFACHRRAELNEDQQVVHGDGQEAKPPRCICNGRLRSAVVWFKEDIPSAPWKAARQMVKRARYWFL